MADVNSSSTKSAKEDFVERALSVLKKEYIVVGKTRVRSWHAWLFLGVVACLIGGIILVANRSGEIEGIGAQVAPSYSFYPDTSGTLVRGLVSYWKLDNASDAIDSLGRNNATVVGTASVVGKISNARSFDGADD